MFCKRSPAARLLPLLLLAAAAASTALAQSDCVLDDSDSLSHCVKRLLNSMRNKVHAKLDPLTIDDVHDCDGRICHHLTGIHVNGLSGYNIENLRVAFPAGGSQLTVAATIGWSGLRGNLDAKVEASARVFGRRRSVSVSASPEIRVRQPVGTLDVTVALAFADDGTVTATPEHTDVTVRLQDVDVDVNLKGVGKWVNFLIGNPADFIANLVVERQWKKEWRDDVEDQAEKELRELITEELGPELSKLLKRLQ